MVDEYHNNRESFVQAFVLFSQVARSVFKYADSYFYKKANISLAKFVVLQALLVSDRNVTVNDIALFAQTEPHNISTLINRMKKEGLVTTKQGKLNKRVVNVELTDKGTDVITKAQPVARQIVDQVMVTTTEDNLAVFLKQLNIMNKNTYDALGRFYIESRKWAD